MTGFKPQSVTEWERHLEATLPLFGHRNWIVVADAAYPMQASRGIETLIADTDHLTVTKKVLELVDGSRHVRSRTYLDRELAVLAEADAPGVAEFRRQLAGLIDVTAVKHLLHDQIIQKLGDAARHFRVMILKTNMTIPYTSVFFELECGYWSSGAETRLREAIARSE